MYPNKLLSFLFGKSQPFSISPNDNLSSVLSTDFTSTTEGLPETDDLSLYKTYLGSFLQVFRAAAWVKDDQLNYIYTNNDYCNFIKFKEEDVLGKDDGSFFIAEKFTEHHNNDTYVLKTGKIFRNVERIYSDSGSFQDLLIIRFPIHHNDQKYVGGTIIDITEEEQLRQEVMSLEDEIKFINKRNERLQIEKKINESLLEEYRREADYWESQLECMLDTQDKAVLVLDNNMHIEKFNHRVHYFWNLTEKDIEKKLTSVPTSIAKKAHTELISLIEAAIREKRNRWMHFYDSFCQTNFIVQVSAFDNSLSQGVIVNISIQD
ncbi:PAS domain S-box protein [Limibacter armeniacum]|uniref:PAS domain S-box protein n=1 Tax=Limibacter armeniacum TaxID=466084 RepID=UPI002FE5ECA3